MIEVEGNIVSIDLLTTPFLCDLGRCKGICCMEGNSGAPLEEDELEQLEAEFEAYRPYMKPEGVTAIEKDGFFIVDLDGDYTTTLIDDAECAYSFQQDGVTLCAIEKAWKEGKTTFRKPISCHLYPIRLAHFSNGSVGLNYHRWSVCRPALECGAKEGVPMYKALKEPITRRFGENFYTALEQAEKYIKENM